MTCLDQAVFLNAKLGIPGVPALDIRQACSGFIYGLSIADQFIKTGMYKNVLVVGSEIQSKGLDKSTEGREVTVLFGDGAGAAVVSRCDGEVKRGDSQIYSTHLYADGMNAKDLMIAAPGQQYPGQRITIEALQNKDQHPKMNGKVVFVNAVKRMPEALQTALDSSGFKIEDVDLFVFHQANIRINEMVAKQLGVPESKIFNTIHKYGNTTAATIPLGLSDAVQEGKLKKGMLVASAAFGAGFTWASAIYRW
jgi:3-oxoacyl-[acyl-carrier-protein] synthase-3